MKRIPGTRVDYFDPDVRLTRPGTVMDIPMDPDTPDEKKYYLIQLDNSAVIKIPLADMPALIPQPPVQIIDEASAILPPFLQLGNKITYEHEGIYYQGYLGQQDGIF